MAASISSAATTTLSIHKLCGGRGCAPAEAPPRQQGSVLCFFHPLPFAGHDRCHRAGVGGASLAHPLRLRTKRRKALTLCFVLADDRRQVDAGKEEAAATESDSGATTTTSEIQFEEALALGASAARAAERQARKKAERQTYLVAAVMSSLGITSMAIAAVYYRFSYQMEVPLLLLASPIHHGNLNSLIRD